MPSNGLWYKQGDSWEIRWRSRNRICAHTHTDGLSQFQRHYISLYYCRGTQQRYIYSGLRVAYVSLKRLGKRGKKKKVSSLAISRQHTRRDEIFLTLCISVMIKMFFSFVEILATRPCSNNVEENQIIQEGPNEVRASSGCDRWKRGACQVCCYGFHLVNSNTLRCGRIFSRKAGDTERPVEPIVSA